MAMARVMSEFPTVPTRCRMVMARAISESPTVLTLCRMAAIQATWRKFSVHEVALPGPPGKIEGARE
jgi:hypothetical protein